MRNYQLFAATAAIFAAATFTSCQNGQSNPGDSDIAAGLKNSKALEFVEYADTAIMNMPNMSEMVEKTAYAQIVVSGTFPTKIGDIDLKPLQNAILQAAYGKTDCTITEGIEHLCAHPVIADEGETLTAATLPLEGDSAMSELYNSVAVQTMTNSLLSMAVSEYFYVYGAAHGMNGTTYINYDITHEQILTADNTFKSSKSTEIISTIINAAKEQYGSNPMVSPEAIKSYNNFYVDDNTITFVYAPYEIAAYAAGQIEVAVDTYRLSDYLSPIGKSALEKL